MRLASAVIVKSQSMRRVLESLGADPSIVTVSPSGGNPDLFYGANPAIAPPLALFETLTPSSSQWSFWKPQNVSLARKNLKSVATHANDDLNDGLNGFYTPFRSLTLYKWKTRRSQTCFDSSRIANHAQGAQGRKGLYCSIKSWMKCSFCNYLWVAKQESGNHSMKYAQKYKPEF